LVATGTLEANSYCTVLIIIITALYSTIETRVPRYRGAGGLRLRLSEQMGLEVSFEGVKVSNGPNSHESDK